MNYSQTYSIELKPNKGVTRELRLSDISYAECRAMAAGLAQFYRQPVNLTVVRDASTTEAVPAIPTPASGKSHE